MFSWSLGTRPSKRTISVSCRAIDIRLAVEVCDEGANLLDHLDFVRGCPLTRRYVISKRPGRRRRDGHDEDVTRSCLAKDLRTCNGVFLAFAGTSHAREVEVREVDAGITQPFALLGNICCRMPLLHERECRVITALGTDAQVVDAMRSKQFEVLIALVLDIGNAAKAAKARDARKLLLDELEDGHEALCRKRVWITAREVDAMLVGAYGLCKLFEIFDDFLARRYAKLDVTENIAEVAFVMRAARDDLQHGTVHDRRRLVLRLGIAHDGSLHEDMGNRMTCSAHYRLSDLATRLLPHHPG